MEFLVLNQLKPESESVTLRLAVYRQFVLTTSPLRLTTSNFIFQLNTSGYSPYITSSLTSGWVCSLQLVLDLASTFSGPIPAGLMTTFYCLKFETPPIWRARSPYLYPPQEYGGPVIPPGTGFPFRRLIRLAGLRWRYSNPPPRWSNQLKLEIHVNNI
jgi:hypothetical protein